MDIKVLKEITKLMKDNDLVEIDVESGDLKVKMRKTEANLVPIPAANAHPPAPAASQPAATAPAKPADESHWKQIVSPIPGTVYLKPSPEAAHFVTEGSQIETGKIVCLIEAMKVFNEIKAEDGIAGQIKRICVKEGQPVEYGTVLFLVG